MKRFFIREKGTPRPYYPFWMPVGALGWLWRTLVFLAALAVFMLLSALLTRSCTGGPGPGLLPPGNGGGGTGSQITPVRGMGAGEDPTDPSHRTPPEVVHPFDTLGRTGPGDKVAPDGTITHPDGSVTKPDGTTTHPDGSVTRPDGSTEHPDGSVTRPDGSTVHPDGSVTKPDDIVNPDGSVTKPDGSTEHPDGSVTKPDGTTINPDGSVTKPDGTTTHPDGTVTGPDGKPRTGGIEDPDNPGHMLPGTTDEKVDNWAPAIPDDKRSPNLPDGKKNVPPTMKPEDSVTSPEDGVTKIDPNHLYVILNSPTVDDAVYNSFADQFAALYPPPQHQIVYYNTSAKTMVLEVPSERRAAIKKNLPSQIKDIDFYVVEVELLGLETYTPDDPAFKIPDYCWQFAPVQAYDAWDITRGKPTVKVAIVDSYFDVAHPDLAGVKIEDPICLARGTRNVMPDPSGGETPYVHGTHVAGIVFGAMGNKEGSAGIAPECTFIPVSIGPVPASFYQVEGILYALYRGATVINVSIGGTSVDAAKVARMSKKSQIELASGLNKDTEALWDYVFKLCDERNVTLVWAAGNSNIYTALDASKRNNHTVKVDAVDKKLRKADFSNFGNASEEGGSEYSTVSAPGVEIVSTIPTAIGSYAPLDGTSMAAPIVTGAVALMKSLNPNLTNEEVVDILKTTAKPLPDKSIGGLLQMADALKKVQEDFLSYDDLISDHTKLIGKWEATRLLTLIINDKPTDVTLKLYMTFPDENSGTLEMIASDGRVYRGPLKVTYSASEVTITETANATVDGTSDRMAKSIHHCTPDSQRFLSVISEQDGRSDDISFNLKKIED